jgi:hypothetical protein
MSAHVPPPGSPWISNSVGDGANVGVQAGGDVRDTTVNMYGLGTTPQETYANGVRALEDGIPGKARELISEALLAEHDNAESRFYWVLAMFSGRSFRELSREERDHLKTAAAKFGNYLPADKYAIALQALGVLLDHLFDGSDGEAITAEKPILELPSDLRDQIKQHLDLVLSGVAMNNLWEGAKNRAETERFASGRSGRVWAYFHPVPIPPRVAPPLLKHPVADRGAREVLVEGAFVLAGVAFSWASLASLNPVSILACLVVIAAGVVGVRDLWEWRYGLDRIMLEDSRRSVASVTAAAATPEATQETRFTNRVRNSFDFYFGTYRPRDVDRDWWLDQTAGVRGHLASEVAYVYRESRIPVDRVNWLIGHIATDVRRQYLAGTLYDYRTRFQVPGRTKLRSVLSLAIALVAAIALFGTAPLDARLALIVALLSGPFAMSSWYRIFRTRRGVHDDNAEAERRLVGYYDAYARWTQKLANLKPSETEMETWLRNDITVLIDRALSEARLEWHDVISHAVLRGPAEGRVRRRAPGGPWRYSKYRLHAFLVTNDGVREVVAELDFEEGKFGNQSRRNFQLDAISSVEVEAGTDGSRVLGLTLTNGPTKKIQVTETSPPEAHPQDAAETPSDDATSQADQELLEMNLDAAGFKHALRLLEGIGADGKGWIDRNRRR